MRVDLLGVVAAASLMQALGQQADGGFRGAAPRDCDTNWSYRTENGAPITEATNGCLSITEFPPYNSLGDQEEDPLFEPQDGRTDKTQWCSFKQNKQQSGNAIYDLSGDLDKITSWGYCLRTDGSAVPTTSTATEVPTSAEPVTNSPTAFALSGPFPKADGGFQTEIVECDSEWTYRDDDNNILVEGITGCVSGDIFPPFQWEGESLAVPSIDGTNTSSWCSTKSQNFPNTVYNVNPGDDADESKRRSWGFCLEESAAATSPTSAPTVSSTGTLAPVSVAGTASPVAAPSEPSSETTAPTSGTSSPTDLGANMPPSPTPQPEPAGLSSGAIAAAVVVPLIVVFALVGGFAYYQYSKGNGEAGAGAAEEQTKEEVAKDPENGQAPMEELRVD